MNYTKIIFDTHTAEQRDILIATLSDNHAFTGFEESENGQLIAYAIEGVVSEAQLQEIVADSGITYTTVTELQQNWNATWEANFEPVLLPGFCHIRAPFHQPVDNLRHEIIIMPKMSFGTGHHATTKLMMLLMKDIDFTEKSVFDYGTGTGILAILAKKMGAGEIVAVDIDEWSFENAKENCSNNESAAVKVIHGGIESIAGAHFDIVLANINRHILLENMQQMSDCLSDNGILLLSGILKAQDSEMIIESATSAGLTWQKALDENGWAAMQFCKK